jgi:NAD(P)-dependent dehydrogenase (short-subunit alcohol dehydrogenase family)
MRPRPRIAIGGRVAVVTGAGRGIGRATALALATRGASVVCADIDGAAAEKTAAECHERGAPARGMAVDVASRGAVVVLADEVERDVGTVGVLVNNAGVGMSGRFTDMSLDDWNWIRAVNLDGVVHCCAAFGPRMLERATGHVVNVSSGLGYTPTASESGYVTTKAAVLALSQCLRADWAAAGVGVSAICPGVIDTAIVEDTRFLGEDAPARRARAVRAFRRGHRPELVAAAIVDAVERNRAVVAVGAEAKLGWYLHRFAPVAVQQAVARAGTRRVARRPVTSGPITSGPITSGEEIR